MKVSLAWIFDHIDADWKKQDVEKIVSTFNYVTAEIEDYQTIHIDIKQLFMGKVLSAEGHEIALEIPELGKKISLPSRKNLGTYHLLAYAKTGTFSWATCKDVHLEKDGLLPAFDISDADIKGGWRTQFEAEDVIFDVDNKSLTHRPDMWGHRGFAREVAAFLRLPHTDKHTLLATHKIQNFENKSKSTPFIIDIQAPEACTRLSSLFIDSIENKPSNLLIASRLIKVGIRPINAIIDLTNYVMLDWSQPVHAYDADKIAGKTLVARMAKKGENIVLLDGRDLALDQKDLVIADSEKAVGLAGVMGGEKDSINEETTSILFESAHFVPTVIRHASLRHGIRTDASARFEKMLDPNQITDAILRFLALCDQTGIKTKISSDIVCVGSPFVEKTIGVRHSFLEQKAGVRFEVAEVTESLHRLGFVVVATKEVLGDRDDILYTITIPSFRGAKDVQIKEDILEEVIRSFGFNKIALVLPVLTTEPGDPVSLFRLRKIKDFLAHAAFMTEQRNYLYYDEDFLKEVGLAFDNALAMRNPVSENNARLATSLLPNLFKNIKHNCATENSLRFFECGRTCRVIGDEVFETKELAGVFFEKRRAVDFYECKQFIVDLLKLCGITEVEWRKIDDIAKASPWIVPFQSAELFVGEKKIGTVGKIDISFLTRLDALPESDGFFFELDAEFLLSYRADVTRYTPISKFPEITFDMCFMIPVSLTVAALQQALRDSDELIERVELIDFFDKEEWVDKRSVAFRIWASDPEKTLEREEIEAVRQNALDSAKNLDAELRH